MKMFLLMILGHFIADFTLQGWFANGKQEMWWREQYADEDNMEFERRWKKYANDYKCAMFEHGLYWSLITFSPLFFFTQISEIALLIIVVANAVFHAWIDDLKANKFKINLIQDQFWHFIQIAITASVSWFLIFK
jgi:hypothetical protein